MKKSKMDYAYLVMLLALGLLVVITLINYQSIPAKIPIQWNGDGQVVNSTTKGSLLASMLLMLISLAAIYYMHIRNVLKNSSRLENIVFTLACSIFILAFAYSLFKVI